MTDRLWPAAMVAALFALHPLRVESVAWIAERRDVLSGLFFMLTLWAYVEYIRQGRSLTRYLVVCAMLALGLLAKSILVTMPALLLLLDFWPLGRFACPPRGSAAQASPAVSPWWLVVEKLPLLVIVLAAASVTWLTHDNGTSPLTVPERLGNAAVACAAYLGQLFVPVGLSVFYAYPEAGWPAWQVAGATALLLTISVAAVVGRRAYPFFFVGWFWYLGMLVPVLGLVYVGAHARADRYTYLSQIGLDIALVWEAVEIGAARPARRWVWGLGSALVLATLMACTWRQTSNWRDDQALWSHALACDENNPTAHALLGAALWGHDDDGARQQYEQALELGPKGYRIYRGVRAAAHNRLGLLTAAQGDLAGAVAHYHQALEADPTLVPAHTNLGSALAKQGEFDGAMTEFRESLKLRPDNTVTLVSMAVAQARNGKIDDAIANLQKAVEVDPGLRPAQMNLATLLAQQGRVDDAIAHYLAAIQIDPDAADPYFHVAQLLRTQGKTADADRYEHQGQAAARRRAERQAQPSGQR